MTPERHARLQQIFLAARELPPEARSAFLDRECAGDAELRALVDALLVQQLSSPASLPREARARPAAPAERPARLAAGTILDGKYRVEARLGAGGMGEVYRARQLALDRDVALKVLLSDPVPDSSKRFEREARTVARLRHPHVVTVYDLGLAPGVGAYLVMEYVDGRSLRDELRRRRRLPVAEAIALMRQVCAGVEAAHAAGVIHRDLKPENVLLEGERLTAKVADFGIAKLASGVDAAGEQLTTPGAVIGTARYMSPEQCRGEELDARSDVYALGVMLYELVAGVPPFTAESAVALYFKHNAEAPRPLGALLPDVPADLERVVARALAKQREQRWQTAAELDEALAGVARGASARGPAEPGAQGCAVTTVAESALAETFVLRPGTGGQAQTTAPPDNLPRPLTRMVGRERELAELSTLLGDEAVRLVTVTGAGGIGKTRLAVEAGRRVLPGFPDGVFLVDLAPLADPALVAKQVARQLGVNEGAAGSITESLARHLREKQVLLVLDNFEHLLTAAPFVADLLASAPAVKALVTSQAPLRLRGEREFALEALELPALATTAAREELERAAAVALFVERARDVKPAFALTDENARAVAEICRRLEGLPLAIELAAARVKLLAPEAMLERLDDRLKLLTGGARDLPERQRTMRGAVAWSYDLLDEVERGLLSRLAVFARGATLEAAEAVCGAEEPDVLDGLASLVDKSLLRQREDEGGETRFLMLEVVREFALERLHERGEADAARAAHAGYFLRLAEEAEPELSGAEQAAWLARLEAEHDNLRAALRWLLERDTDACLRLAKAVRFLWLTHGHHAEGRRWLEAALERSHTAPARARAYAVGMAGTLARQQGDLAAARAYHEEELRIGQETGDARLVGWACRNLGDVALVQGDLPTARRYYEESLARGQEMKNDRVVGGAFIGLGELAREEGAWAEARALYEQAVAHCKRAGDHGNVSITLTNLGAVAREEGDLVGASAAYRDALVIAQALRYQVGIGLCLEGMGSVAAASGAWARAARLGGAAEALREEVGAVPEPLDQRLHDGWVGRLREALDLATLEREWAHGRAMTAEEAVREALEESDG